MLSKRCQASIHLHHRMGTPMILRVARRVDMQHDLSSAQYQPQSLSHCRCGLSHPRRVKCGHDWCLPSKMASSGHERCKQERQSIIAASTHDIVWYQAAQRLWGKACIVPGTLPTCPLQLSSGKAFGRSDQSWTRMYSKRRGGGGGVWDPKLLCPKNGRTFFPTMVTVVLGGGRVLLGLSAVLLHPWSGLLAAGGTKACTVKVGSQGTRRWRCSPNQSVRVQNGERVPESKGKTSRSDGSYTGPLNY